MVRNAEARRRRLLELVDLKIQARAFDQPARLLDGPAGQVRNLDIGQHEPARLEDPARDIHGWRDPQVTARPPVLEGLGLGRGGRRQAGRGRKIQQAKDNPAGRAEDSPSVPPVG